MPSRSAECVCRKRCNASNERDNEDNFERSNGIPQRLPAGQRRATVERALYPVSGAARAVRGYVEALQMGHLLFLSGMLPTEGREAKIMGRVGAELDVEAGRKALTWRRSTSLLSQIPEAGGDEAVKARDLEFTHYAP